MIEEDNRPQKDSRSKSSDSQKDDLASLPRELQKGGRELGTRLFLYRSRIGDFPDKVLKTIS